MNVQGKHFRTIWLHPERMDRVQIIDQRFLPHEWVIADIRSPEEAAMAIKDMWVRGAPLIGATAAWGMYLAAADVPARCNMHFYFEEVYAMLLKTRPTAINLKWALQMMLGVLKEAGDPDEAKFRARRMAQLITDQDAAANEQIGVHGVTLIREIFQQKKEPVQILTHCNAGWLATVDWGTATAPIYKASAEGIPVHVWVDETRPRNQGASLTAWELGQMGVPHTLITDNAGGHLMQKGMVDLVLTGADRVDRQGNAANKIGTYLKALAAADNGIPFYVALPSSTIDWEMENGVQHIPVEERSEDEVLYVNGLYNKKIVSIQIAPAGTRAFNPAFDITPARLLTGLITERGICRASQQGLSALFPDASTM
jgi:methylthioribose-1-phosphate isomerase